MHELWCLAILWKWLNMCHKKVKNINFVVIRRVLSSSKCTMTCFWPGLCPRTPLGSLWQFPRLVGWERRHPFSIPSRRLHLGTSISEDPLLVCVLVKLSAITFRIYCCHNLTGLLLSLTGCREGIWSTLAGSKADGWAAGWHSAWAVPWPGLLIPQPHHSVHIHSGWSDPPVWRICSCCTKRLWCW